MPSRPARRALVFGSAAILLALSIYFRSPVLLNAPGLNSDVAVVGLQAGHLGKGEWSPFLWGSGYQSSVDGMVARVWFALFGTKPWALLASALAMHIALTFGVWVTLLKRVGLACASALALMLVFTTPPIHSFALYPPREASLALVMFAMVLADRISQAKKPKVLLAISSLLAGLSCFADPYARLLYPVWFVLALLTAWDEEKSRRERMLHGALLLAWSLVGLVPDTLLRHSSAANAGPMGLSASVLSHNWRLLWDTCGPWAFGTRPLYAPNVSDYQPWPISSPLLLTARFGTALFLAMTASGGALFFARRIPFPVRRLGLAGALGVYGTFAAFLCSVMVMDHFSMRYLASAFLLAPFAMAPIAWLLAERVRGGAAVLFASLAPYLVASAVCGWVAFFPYYRGAVPVRDALGQGTPDYALGQYLKDAHVDYAMADYWASYRLTFLFQEKPIVVPKNAGEDRYPPYRRAFEAAKRVAYIYDPGRSRESEEERARTVSSLGQLVSQARVGPFTVYVVER